MTSGGRDIQKAYQLIVALQIHSGACHDPVHTSLRVSYDVGLQILLVRAIVVVRWLDAYRLTRWGTQRTCSLHSRLV